MLLFVEQLQLCEDSQTVPKHILRLHMTSSCLLFICPADTNAPWSDPTCITSYALVLPGSIPFLLQCSLHRRAPACLSLQTSDQPVTAQSPLSPPACLPVLLRPSQVMSFPDLILGPLSYHLIREQGDGLGGNDTFHCKLPWSS